MKKKMFLILFIFSFFMGKIPVFAVKYQGVLTGNGVNLRTGPGTNHSYIASLHLGSTYELESNEKIPSEMGCAAGWYKLKYSPVITGYACSDYIEVKEMEEEVISVDGECEQSLIALGFHQSYVTGLCALKKNRPNWNFYPIITNIDWQTAVNQESKCGLSYVYTNSSNTEFIDSSCIGQYPNGPYPASKKAVAIYMDPRNWFNENTIFQFENLKYTEGLYESYSPAITSIVQSANFYTYHVQNGVDFSGTLREAGKDANVSPIFLASRILQELGRTTSLFNLYSGVYPGEYYGYYNFYNYGVSDSCVKVSGTTYCGLSYAKSKGWNSIYGALHGGAVFLSSGYIAVGQDTMYLQKFNVNPNDKNKLFLHQYMTNIGAPVSESKITYSTYNNNSLLDLPYNFYIPVYTNMDVEIVNSNSGSTPDDTPTIPSNSEISTIATKAGYSYSSGYLNRVKDETSVEALTNAFVSLGATVNIKNTVGEKVTSGNVGTGYTITISNATTSEDLKIVVKGDTSGDGKINALDLLQVHKNILGMYNLNDAQIRAADSSNDGKVGALDLLQIHKNILGMYKINE
ncbi:MAG: hypothetical protein GX951_00150 [Mollicutes bacterium]|nr:hypothetical protein [Mollicutes bacterium]